MKLIWFQFCGLAVSVLERTYLIDGMHCKSCVEIIREELLGMECIESADVSLEERTAQVRMREECDGIIIETIQRLGYSARVLE
jgi:copper chaperone CopZ